jgi:hypothetical protein
VSRSLRSRSRKVGGCLPGRGHCSAGDPIAGLLSRGRERDLPGFQAIHPVPLPRSRTPAESTIPRLLTVPSMLPPLVRQRRLQRINHIGAIARLQHLLPTLQEWCCHRPCKARFRPAGSPLPGGSRTLWITTKGFRSHSRPPLLDLSWRNVRAVFPHTACMGLSLSMGGSRHFCLPLSFHSFVRPAPRAFFRPDRIFPSPSRAASVKDGASSAPPKACP